MPTHRPTRWPTANSANDRLKSKPVAPPLSPPSRKYCATSLAKTLVCDDHVEHRRDDAAPDHGLQARAAGFDSPRWPSPRSLAGAHLQHLGAGHAFGIGQVGIGDQRAAQRNRVHHAEHAAGGADARTRSRTESRSTSRSMTRPGSTKMIADSVPAAEAMVWTMLFSWIVASLIASQDRHRDHRGRDRGGEGQAGLEAEINVRGSEHERDDDADDQAAEGQFGTRLGFCMGLDWSRDSPRCWSAEYRRVVPFQKERSSQIRRKD